MRLTEVEAYEGERDPGSHAFRGPRRRNAVMYGPAGRLYTYFTYGMHVCANVVCGPEGVASAVLLRAGRVVAGADRARHRRTTSRSELDLARGPALLVRALGIALDDGGLDLLDPDGAVRLELPLGPPASYGTGPRTGVAGEGGSGERYPWRFFLDGDPTVSPYRAAVPRRRTGSAVS